MGGQANGIYTFIIIIIIIMKKDLLHHKKRSIPFPLFILFIHLRLSQVVSLLPSAHFSLLEGCHSPMMGTSKRA